jgi:hypothetical protein
MIIKFYIPMSCGEAVQEAKRLCCAAFGGYTLYTGVGGWCSKPWDNPRPVEEAVVILEVLVTAKEGADFPGATAWVAHVAELYIGPLLAACNEQEFLYVVDFTPYTIQLQDKE